MITAVTLRYGSIKRHLVPNDFLRYYYLNCLLRLVCNYE